MKRSIHAVLFAIGALGLTVLGACSDNATNNDQATVQWQSQLNGSAVTFAKVIAGPGATVDSLQVTSVKVLVTRLKLHRDKADTTGDHNVKTEPFVITFAGPSATFANASIPAGTYDKVKFEFHHPESSQIQQYLQLPEFAPFVTGGAYTVIIEGTLYKNGTPTTFSYKSDVNANLSINFDTPLVLAAGSTTTLVLKVNPVDVFKKGTTILDPRDVVNNESEIDNAIKAAIKAQKK